MRRVRHHWADSACVHVNRKPPSLFRYKSHSQNTSKPTFPELTPAGIEPAARLCFRHHRENHFPRGRHCLLHCAAATGTLSTSHAICTQSYLTGKTDVVTGPLNSTEAGVWLYDAKCLLPILQCFPGRVVFDFKNLHQFRRESSLGRVVAVDQV